jgi:hypothetical protein
MLIDTILLGEQLKGQMKNMQKLNLWIPSSQSTKEQSHCNLQIGIQVNAIEFKLKLCKINTSTNK